MSSNNPFFAVFPGQGSQFVGMGRDLCENFKIAREIFEEASDSTSLNIKKLCMDGPDSDLILTENTQPCLLTTSVAAFRVAETEFGFKPAAVAGHSLGEYSALVAARALPLGLTALWVKERGKAMQSAVPAGEGTMAAILNLPSEDTQIGVLCEKATAQALAKRAELPESTAGFQVPCIVQPANFNAPGQIVIAGSTDAVAEAVALCKSDPQFSGAKAMPLSVSAPFHCKLMAQAKDRMAELFSAAENTAKTPIFPYVPNRTARLTQEKGILFELLIEQVDQPVLWKQSVQALIASNASPKGLTRAVEFGPGKVLCGLIRRIDSDKLTQQMSVGDKAGIQALETLWKGTPL